MWTCGIGICISLVCSGGRPRAGGASARRAAGLPWGGEWTGPDGMMNFVAKVVEHLNQKSFICEDMIAEGDTVIAWGYCETACAHTGREARIDWIHRVEMRDGRMVSVDNFYDSLNAAEALGRAKLL